LSLLWRIHRKNESASAANIDRASAETTTRNKKGKEDRIMKRIGIAVSMLVLAGSLAANSAMAADNGTTMKQRLNSNYCHMKFPEIDQGTLASNNPQLGEATPGNLVDFYGPCDESPTGTDQVIQQRLEEDWHNPVSNH